MFNEQISSQRSKEAQQAVTIFHDLFPKELCEGGEKLWPGHIPKNGRTL